MLLMELRWFSLCTGLLGNHFSAPQSIVGLKRCNTKRENDDDDDVDDIVTSYYDYYQQQQ